MKKLKSILIIMLFVLFPSTVFASSGSASGSGGFPLGVALRNGGICFNTYVNFCTKSFIKNNFKR